LDSWITVALLGTVVLLASCSGPGSSANRHNAPHVLSGGHGTTTAATLDVVSGTTAVRVTTGPLGGDLYRVSTPRGSGIRPLASVTGHTVQVGQTGTAGVKTAVPAIAIVLAPRVHWTIDLDGGATTETVDMRGGSLRAVDFGAGVSRASVDLPAPTTTETLTLAGGASQLSVVAPPGSPARVVATGGASEVRLDNDDHHGVAGGSVFTEPGWAQAQRRYDIRLTAGVSDFQMTRS
jgi:hypothetical protein